MKQIALAAALYIALILELVLAPRMAIGILRPDLLMMLWLVVLMLPGRQAIFWSGVVGLAADSISVIPLGSSVVILPLAALLYQARTAGGTQRDPGASFGWAAIVLFLVIAARQCVEWWGARNVSAVEVALVVGGGTAYSLLLAVLGLLPIAAFRTALRATSAPWARSAST